jgi:hypothetical protein
VKHPNSVSQSTMTTEARPQQQHPPKQFRMLTAAEIQQVRDQPPPPAPSLAVGSSSDLSLSCGCFTWNALQKLEENNMLIRAINENQNLGKLEECLQ